MAADPSPRSRRARLAAERALVGVALEYGAPPPFVLLGGLVPDLLCPTAPIAHIGTTDVDVQLDVEIAMDGVHAAALEQALLRSGFEPTAADVWRWRLRDGDGSVTVVTFELLADRDDAVQGAVIGFDACERLGAVNLRGTGWVARDHAPCTLRGDIDGVEREVAIRVAGLGGYLLAKMCAARSRRATKDWYDIAYVLQHNAAGGPKAAGEAVAAVIDGAMPLDVHSALVDLEANFATRTAQGAMAYAQQVRSDHPDVGDEEARLDARLAVEAFCEAIRHLAVPSAG